MRRIRCDLIFEQAPEADEVWSALKTYLAKKQISSIALEKSYIEYEECHHDESPHRPCEILEHLEKG